MKYFYTMSGDKDEHNGLSTFTLKHVVLWRQESETFERNETSILEF